MEGQCEGGIGDRAIQNCPPLDWGAGNCPPWGPDRERVRGLGRRRAAVAAIRAEKENRRPSALETDGLTRESRLPLENQGRITTGQLQAVAHS